MAFRINNLDQHKRVPLGKVGLIPPSSSRPGAESLTQAQAAKTRAWVAAVQKPRPDLSGYTNVWYMESDGDDITGDGSASNPYQTVDKALAVRALGDAIKLGSGVFTFSPSFDRAVPTTCLTGATFDSDLRITSGAWQDAGTGVDPDGSQADLGVYGGQYPW